MEPEIYNVILTAEITERLAALIHDLCDLIQQRTQNPLEALIVVDALRREIEHSNDIALLGPMHSTQIGHT